MADGWPSHPMPRISSPATPTDRPTSSSTTGRPARPRGFPPAPGARREARCRRWRGRPLGHLRGGVRRVRRAAPRQADRHHHDGERILGGTQAVGVPDPTPGPERRWAFSGLFLGCCQRGRGRYQQQVGRVPARARGPGLQRDARDRAGFPGSVRRDGECTADGRRRVLVDRIVSSQLAWRHGRHERHRQRVRELRRSTESVHLGAQRNHRGRRAVAHGDSGAQSCGLHVTALNGAR